MDIAADCEHALFPRRLVKTLPPGYSRLYFGSEFCAWAFPPPDELQEAFVAARREGWAFTLATPVMTETFLPRLAATLSDLLPRFAEGDEVMISDLGALQAVRSFSRDIPVILGRVLSGQKRGPQILEMNPTGAQLAYFRQGSWYGREASSFLRLAGISRVELDNVPQGIAPLPCGLAGTLHHPFAMVTSSRNCPFRNPVSPRCGRDCGETFTLLQKEGAPVLIQGGNTQFIRLDTLPETPRRLGIDRLVFHPDIPR